MAVRLPLLILICTPTAPHPDGTPPGFLPFYSPLSPWPCASLEALLLVTLTAPLSIHLNFISTVVCLHAFFIDLLFCCLPGIYPPVRGTVLANLEIDLSLRDGSDIVRT